MGILIITKRPGVKVSVGGIRQRHDNQKGYLSHSSYEFNFKDQNYNDED